MPTPSDLRADLARNRMSRYKVAAEIGIHPARLGQMLNERLPMPAQVAARVSEAIRRGTEPIEK